MPRPALRPSDLFADVPHDSDIWSGRLLAAFADANFHSGFLPLAEQAVETCPGDAIIHLLAATAALLDKRPQRALVFLKRFSERASAPVGHLLHALALNQLNKRAAARALLESNGLTSRWSAARAFPGGSKRLPWLILKLDHIVGREVPCPGRRPAARVKGKPKTATKGDMAARPRKAPTPAAVAVVPAPPPLPSVNIDFPFTIEFDVAPLLSAIARDVEPGGRWFRLRERFAHLGLAQGFDEHLCLPHLTGVEPLLHQIETVRKVLKQFRGRVLLADEVGLGKTIEAGMVLKEHPRMQRSLSQPALVEPSVPLNATVAVYTEESCSTMSCSNRLRRKQSMRMHPAPYVHGGPHPRFFGKSWLPVPLTRAS